MSATLSNTSFGLYDRLVLTPLGLDRESGFVCWFLILSLGLTAYGLWKFEGDMPVLLAIFYMIAIGILSLLRVDISFYVLVASVLVFDQYAIPGFPAWTHDIGFFSNLKEISYLPFFDAGVVNPLEMHLAFITFSLMIMAVVRDRFSFQPIPVWLPFLFFTTTLLLSFFRGIQGGGDFLIAMWETRALFYLCIVYLIVPQIIRTKQQITILMWVFIAGITVKAIQGIGRFVDLGFTTGGFDVLTNHEDAVFIVTLMILLIGFFVFKVDHKQKGWLILLLIPLALGFYVAQRRASYASLIVCIAVVMVVLPALNRRMFLAWFLPVLAGILLYGFLFWNSSATIATPVQMVKSGLVEPDATENYRDYHSNLYRKNENYNLAQTVVGQPVFGTGFGKAYDQPIPLVNIRFPLRDYIPHNQIYWVMVKMGVVGFFAFWFFFHAAAAKGTQILIRLQDPYLKAVTLFIVAAVINQMVVSFFDLQLTYYRNMIYLGTLLGLLSSIEQIHLRSLPDSDKGKKPDKKSKAVPGTKRDPREGPDHEL